MARSMTSTATALTLLLAATAILSLSNTAEAIKGTKIPQSGNLFYNRFYRDLYYYPKQDQFKLAQCTPRDPETTFSLYKSGKNYYVKWAYTPSDISDPRFFFNAFTKIYLNIVTGALRVESYAATINIDLAKYLPTDEYQTRYRLAYGGNVGKQVKVMSIKPYFYNSINNKKTPAVLNGDNVAIKALDVLSKTAKKFSAAEEVPYECREKKTTPGSKNLGNLVTYLEQLKVLPTIKA